MRIRSKLRQSQRTEIVKKPRWRILTDAPLMSVRVSYTPEVIRQCCTVTTSKTPIAARMNRATTANTLMARKPVNSRLISISFAAIRSNAVRRSVYL